MLLALGLGLAVAGGLFSAAANYSESQAEEEEARTQAAEQQKILERQRDTARKQAHMQAGNQIEDIAQQQQQTQSSYTASLGARGISQGSGSASAIRTEVDNRADQATGRVEDALDLRLESIQTTFDAGENQVDAVLRGADRMEGQRGWQLGADLFNTASTAVGFF